MPHDEGSQLTPAVAVPGAVPPTKEVVEVPVHSPRWSFLFFFVGFGILFIGGFFTYYAPSLLTARADRICARESAERALDRGGQAFPYVSNLSAECERAQSFHREYDGKLATRGQNFLQGVLPLVAMFFLIARRLRAKRTLEHLCADRRAPVAYLRSFADDEGLFKGQYQLSQQSDEAKLVQQLDKRGPVLAIGKPGAKLAQLGAARLYLAQGDWQNVVRKLLSVADLVVIRVANTPGLRWELATVRQMLPARRVVLWFPQALRKKDRGIVREYLRAELETTPPRHDQSGYVTYKDDWTVKDVSMVFPHAILTSSANSKTSVGVVDRMRELGVDFVVPPSFRLHWLGAVVAALWFALSVLVPGPRWSFEIADFLEVQSELVSPAIEIVTVLAAALGLAFLPYIRRPAARWLPTLLFCTVLLFDSAWIGVRAQPRTSDRIAALCGRVTECSPEEMPKPTLEQCIADFSGYLPPATERGPVLQMLEGVSDRCWARGCDDFALCLTLEPMMQLSSSVHGSIADLICAAKKAQPTAAIDNVDLSEPHARTLYTVIAHKTAGTKLTDDGRSNLTAYAITAPWTCQR